MATGAQASIHWGWEQTAGGADNFGGGALQINKAFGYGAELDSDFDRNMEYRFGSGSRNWQSAKGMKNTGSLKVSADLDDPWIIEGVIGGHATITGAAGSYATTFSEVDLPPTLEVDTLQVNTAGFLLKKYVGVAIKNFNFGWQAGDNTPIRYDIEADYADVTPSTPEGPINQTLPQQAYSLSFANATVLTSTNGTDYTAIANLDKADVKINNNIELKHTSGSQKATRRRAGQREYDVSLTVLDMDPTVFLYKVFGSTGAPSATHTPTAIPYLKVLLSAEVGGTMAFIFTNVIPGKHTPNGIKGPSEELMETVDLIPQTCSVVLAGWDNTEPTRV